MNPLEELDRLLLQISTLNGPTLLIFTLWMVGYFFKIVPMINNKWIPLITFVAALGMTPFLVIWPDVGQQGLTVKFPGISAWIQTFDRGILYWAVSWVTHQKVLKKYIDDKLNGVLNGNGKTQEARGAVEPKKEP